MGWRKRHGSGDTPSPDLPAAMPSLGVAPTDQPQPFTPFILRGRSFQLPFSRQHKRDAIPLLLQAKTTGHTVLELSTWNSALTRGAGRCHVAHTPWAQK